MLKTSHVLLTTALAISAVLPAPSKAQTSGVSGAVFVMTNAADNNQIVAYKRNSDGSLQEGQTFPTGGRGSGGVTDPLGSQGALTLNEKHTLLFAVNAGSGNISVFQVKGAKLTLLGTVPCGGSEPVAVAQQGNLLYVVNAGGASDLVGFRLTTDGHLKQIAGSTTYLSTGTSEPGSLSFSPDGQFLLVTEKLTNNIDAFHIQSNGTLGPIVVNPSAGPGAFAVSFAPNGTALLVETGPTGGTNASAISSYTVVSNGTLTPVSSSVPTLGAATCWLAVTPNGQFAYTSNSASSTISGFALGAGGALTPVSGTLVGTNPTGSINLEIVISSDGKYLYTLDSGTGTVGIFGINQDGTLTNLGDAGGLSEDAGLEGMAAF
ncbi:MAG TPA: beta-propeller fold lactonase family protein [Candidatus Sulfotelmatobacter sp.]|nr:beta-propeller fold lactonase family protein [Candidatus Sulfotelmatobacter sp.]